MIFYCRRILADNIFMERTLVLIKPDGVKRGLTGEIISRFEKVGLKIVACKMVWPDKEFIAKHYPVERVEWVRKIGEKKLEAYKEYGRDIKEVLGTEDAEKIGRQVCQWLVDYLTSGPVLSLLLEGHRAVTLAIKMTGYTLPDLANPGTIRGDYSLDASDLADSLKRPLYNLVHCSGSVEEAQYEEKLWFKPEEIFDYKQSGEEIMYG